MFTVAVVSLMLVTAVGIDFGNALVVKQKLISAADAAALAVGAEPNLTEEEANAKAEAFIRAHYPEEDFGNLLDFSVVSNSAQVDVTVTARIPTTFLKVARVDTIDVTVHSQVLRQQRDIEVVMALDNTGSMASCSPFPCQPKIDRLKAAATKLVDILFGDDTVSEHVKIGLVPFSAAVNIGADKIGSGWLDVAGASQLQREDINLSAGTTLLGLFDQVQNVNWGGCVRARITPTEQDLDLTDTPPGAGDTLWVPYFAPDEPGTGNGPGSSGVTADPPSPPNNNNYYNDYISDGTSGTNAERQAYAGKYTNVSVSSARLNEGLGPNFNCVPQRIQALTNVKSTITTAIAGMQAKGSTVIPSGLGWGWRVISPTAPYTEGASYDDQRVAKAIILLTDGRNQVEGDYGHNHSFYSSYGFASKGHLGSTSGSQTRQVLDQKTTALCNAVKADKDGIADDQDIYVYTLTFQVADESTRTMMRNCATPPSDCPGEACYFDSPTASDLENAFESIALGLSKLRLAR